VCVPFGAFDCVWLQCRGNQDSHGPSHPLVCKLGTYLTEFPGSSSQQQNVGHCKCSDVSCSCALSYAAGPEVVHPEPVPPRLRPAQGGRHCEHFSRVARSACCSMPLTVHGCGHMDVLMFSASLAVHSRSCAPDMTFRLPKLHQSRTYQGASTCECTPCRCMAPSCSCLTSWCCSCAAAAAPVR
jgi:hypothetical protein